MLTAEELRKLPDKVTALYTALETKLLKVMTRSVKRRLLRNDAVNVLTALKAEMSIRVARRNVLKIKRKKIYYINIINPKKRKFPMNQAPKTTMKFQNCGLIKNSKELQKLFGITTLKKHGLISVTGSVLQEAGLKRHNIT